MRASRRYFRRPTRARAVAFASLVLVVALTASGCCKKGDKATAVAKKPERSAWRDEVVDEVDGMAKPVKAPAGSAAPPGDPNAGKPQDQVASDFRPVVPDAPAAQAGPGELKAPTGPSPWGATDAESGKPLPKRPKPNKAAKALLIDGERAALAGDDNAARKAFERALAADSKAFEAAHNLGVLADRKGQTNVALQYYGKALAIQPDYERSAEGTARIYLRQGSPTQAVGFVQPLATKWQRNLELLAVYATVLAEAGRLDESEKVARQALRRDERFVPAMVALAKANLKRNRLELADSILEQALTVDPKNAEAHYLQAQRHAQEGRTAQAIASYRKAVQLAPHLAQARSELGLMYLAAGNYSEALTELEAVAKLLPSLPPSHLNVGDAYRANKRWQDAKRAFDNALRLQSNLPEAHFNMGLLYLEAGEGFPGLTKLESLQRAQLELTTYREQMGPRLRKDDPSVGYIADLGRQIEREQRRLEREAAKKQRDAERGPSDGQEK